MDSLDRQDALDLHRETLGVINDAYNEGVEAAAKALDFFVIHTPKDKQPDPNHLRFNTLVAEFQEKIRKEKKQ